MRRAVKEVFLMKKRVMLAKIALLVVGCVGCGNADDSVEPGQKVSDKSEALLEVDLASDTEWTFSIDGGAPRPIKVPAGAMAFT
jgi:hypothetical protein